MKTLLIGFIFSIITFLSPIKGILVVMGLAVLIDTVAAILVAKSLGDEITSNKFFNIAIKLFFYFGGIIFGFLIDIFICEGGLFGITYFGAKSTAVAFIANEVKSINEVYERKYNKSLYKTLKEYIQVMKNLKSDISSLFDKK